MVALWYYIINYDFHIDYDVFIDADNGKVYSCVRNTSTIVDSWETLDDCFCSIYHSFDDMEDEYEYKSLSI